MRTFFCAVLLCLHVAANASSESTEMKRAIDTMQEVYHVSFVYDSALADVMPAGRPLPDKTLTENLNIVLGGTGIKWEIKDEYVLLFRQNKYTFSGYVCQDNGESLINVTVYDKTTRTGTLTDEHGFFSITLPEGKHVLRVSYIGYEEVVKELDLQSDYFGTIYLKESTTALAGVEVTANLNDPLFTTQTGKVSFTPELLNTEFSLLSSPDLVKSIQNLPGVSSGTELLSGLYVHGGRNDENMFLLDGTPLYQVNHLGGLFSAFNTDVVKNVDFYKSGFPARYGGRTASVIDVRTREGDMKEYHGTFSIGLLDGRFQFEGPVIKDKTSFSFGMRRSWMDLLTTPALWIANRNLPDKNIKTRYAFHDINAKITHRFSDRNKLSLSVYSARDLFKSRVLQQFPEGYMFQKYEERDENTFHIRWGNLSVGLNWNGQLTPKLSGNVSLVYARNLAKYSFLSDESYYEQDKRVSMERMQRSNYSTIDDVGYRMEFSYRPAASHHIRLGSNYLFHLYHPQRIASQDIRETAGIADTLSSAGEGRYRGSEISFYVEDDMQLTEKLRVNAGLHYVLYRVTGATYHSLEPRLSVGYRLFDWATLKASYTEMSQFVHQLSNSYLNLPTDCWVPSTSRIRPMRSRQVAGGIYMKLPWNLSMDIEGYFRITDRMLEYDTGGNLTLPADNWEKWVRVGKGKSYGLEASLAYRHAKNVFQASYTLSWSKQKFEDFYPDWYASKFDNRHKLNLMFRHKFNNRIDAYAAWTFRSGDRATVPMQYVENPSLPGTVQPSDAAGSWVYEKPNNITLPAYHRLDVGINFRRTTKRGFERIWNISIYNAYCRMNAFYTQVERQADGSFRGKAIGLFPVIPSFSYTLKF